jgi:hypothetical protein
MPGGSLQTMITKYEIDKYLNLGGWVELFIWLQGKELTNSETIRIMYTQVGCVVVCPIKMPLHLGPDDLVWTVHIQQVKANAFDEIFNRLPSAESIHLIQELVSEIAQRAEVTGEHIHTFINNLPTRTECK